MDAEAMPDQPTFIDARELSLEDWLALVRGPRREDVVFLAGCFPSDRHRTEFLDRIDAWTDADMRLLLRSFLVNTGTNETDDASAAYLFHRLNAGTRRLQDLREHELRLLRMKLTGDFPVWEGIHWTIDLLPRHPRSAIAVLDAFFLASCQHLKDMYLTGLDDAKAIIRARYLANPADHARASAILDSLDWRELEWLCGALYRAMGFEVTVTPRSNDDGIDVLAEQHQLGNRQRLVVQAKKRSPKNRLKKQDWHAVLGAVVDHRATSGVLVTTGLVQKGVKSKAASDARCQSIDRGELLELLAEFCGAAWYTRADALIREAKQHAARKA